MATSPIVLRARAQRSLLLTLAWALTVTAVLAALCALLIGPGMTRGLGEHLRTSGTAMHVTATIVLEPEAAAMGTQAIDQAVAMTAAAAAPVTTESSVWASSPLFYLPGRDPRVTYMLDADTVRDNAFLVDGRWPELPDTSGADVEAVLLTSTAAVLGLSVGDAMILAPHATDEVDGGPGARTAKVVGIADWEPANAQTWSRDRLGGNGEGTALTLLPAYGPLLVAPGTLVDADQPVERASIETAPHLFDNPAQASDLAARMGSVKSRIEGELGDAVAAMSVQSQLAPTIADAQAQQVRSVAMTAALLVAVIAVAAAALGHVGGAVAGRRGHEWTLALERGASTWQAVRSTLVEVGVLALVGAAVGVVLAPPAYRGLAEIVPAWWPQASGVGEPSVTGWVIAASLAGAIVPALAVGWAAWRGVGATAGQRGTLRADVARWRRAGLTLGVVVLAGVGYLQLRSRAPDQLGIDPLLVVGPMLALLAAALVATWLVPLIARGVESLVKKSRGLVLPVAAWRGARADGSRSALPTVLAAAAVVCAVAVGATWLQSQEDQSEVAVGADLTVSDLPGWRTGGVVHEATGASPVPVMSRPVQLGSRPGSASIVAVDAQHAGALMRGRAPATAAWEDATAPLAIETAPTTPRGIAFDGSAPPALMIGGTVDSFAPVALEVVPTAIIEDQWGEISTVPGEPVILDGDAHLSPLAGDVKPADLKGARLIGVNLEFDLWAIGDGAPAVDQSSVADITIAVPGAASEQDDLNADWHVTTVASTADRTDPSDRSTAVPYTDGTLTVAVGVRTFATSAARAIALATPPVDEVPVLVSEQLAGEYGVGPEDVLDLRMSSASVRAHVVGVVPYVPSRPGANVILADHDALTRALFNHGEIGANVDAWWVQAPQAGSVATLTAAGLPGAVAMADAVAESRSGAWNTPVMGALGVLLVAAVLLAWTAAGATASGLAQQLRRTNARLRGMGARRSHVRRIATVNAVMTVTAQAVVGGAAGGLVAWAVAPWVVAGDGGQRPIPSVIFDVSPTVSVACLGVLVVGLVLVTLPAARAGASAAVPVALREGDAA